MKYLRMKSDCSKPRLTLSACDLVLANLSLCVRRGADKCNRLHGPNFLRCWRLAPARLTNCSTPGTSLWHSARRTPATPGRYLDLDLVAMAIMFGLTPPFGRKYSTAIVSGFFHQWASAVGHAEAEPSQDFFMAVGGVGWDATKRRPKLLVVTNGTVGQIADDFHGMKDLAGFFNVNISDIIRRLRARAHAAGIDSVMHSFSRLRIVNSMKC